MTPDLRWFGVTDAEDLLGRFHNWSGSQDRLVQYLIVIGAFLVVTLGAFIWAAFFRRRHRRHRRHSHRRNPESPPGTATREGGSPSTADSSNRRRRHRRRPERHLNPTLAQTGGLPPPRSGEPGKSETRP